MKRPSRIGHPGTEKPLYWVLGSWIYVCARLHLAQPQVDIRTEHGLGMARMAIWEVGGLAFYISREDVALSRLL